MAHNRIAFGSRFGKAFCGSESADNSKNTAW
jgi:hypothetical protein